MPFTANSVEKRILAAHEGGRLGHAYLLVSQPYSSGEKLFYRLACGLLDCMSDELDGYPDLHQVKPESKSRRITVEQIRELEQQLQLKSYRGGLKVAAVHAADRMCLPPATAANAFLKTLEEPPDNSVLFLITDRPDLLLTTIRSRCLSVTLASEQSHEDNGPLPEWADLWLSVEGAPADRAYLRSNILQAHWRSERERIESEHTETGNNDAAVALLESHFQLARDQSIGRLIRAVWEKRDQLFPKTHEAIRACEALEELRRALSRNIDAQLSLERCCLRISGLI